MHRKASDKQLKNQAIFLRSCSQACATTRPGGGAFASKWNLIHSVTQQHARLCGGAPDLGRLGLVGERMMWRVAWMQSSVACCLEPGSRLALATVSTVTDATNDKMASSRSVEQCARTAQCMCSGHHHTSLTFPPHTPHKRQVEPDEQQKCPDKKIWILRNIVHDGHGSGKMKGSRRT